jgi:type IV pilus assembly protein PilA
MVVVVIMGILATLGFASLSKHVSAAWGVEAMNMVQSIRAAEERWRSEHMTYLNVSTDPQGWYPVDPSVVSNRRTEHAFYYEPGSTAHADANNWLLLRPTTPGPVRFGYLVNAGHPGTAMTVPSGGPSVTWPAPPDNWYVIQAIGDTDGDGTLSYYRASSLDSEVFTQNHGE